MKRREFLRLALGAGVAAGTFLFGNPLRPCLRLAHAAEGKTVVVIFQRGGCDGLNTVVPYGDSAYEALRPTIAIAPPDPENPESAIDLDGFFGLHPSLASFEEIFLSGDMAIFPAVQYPSASRSHFDGQHFIESAASLENRAYKDDLDGWLNRHMQTHAHEEATMRAASFGNSLAQSLRGKLFVSSFNDLGDYSLGLDDEDVARALLSRLGPVYSEDPDQTTPYRRLVHDSGRVAINNLGVVSEINRDTYVPDNDAAYPLGTYGSQLKQIAQLIKAGVGLEIATASIGGWDNHSGQGGGDEDGRQARRLKEFSDGIAALYTDLGSSMSDVVILTMTEFGRTAKENGSFGTDHGNASAWFAVTGGANIVPDDQTGYIYGTWPGLGASELLNGRYLAHNIDYRNLMGEILTKFLGNPDLSVVFRGGTNDPNDPDSPAAYSPVGFLA